MSKGQSSASAGRYGGVRGGGRGVGTSGKAASPTGSNSSGGKQGYPTRHAGGVAPPSTGAGKGTVRQHKVR
jgi:hypothetical protein